MIRLCKHAAMAAIKHSDCSGPLEQQLVLNRLLYNLPVAMAPALPSRCHFCILFLLGRRESATPRASGDSGVDRAASKPKGCADGEVVKARRGFERRVNV